MGHHNTERYNRKRGYHSDFEDYESDFNSYSRDKSRSKISNKRILENNHINRVRSNSFNRNYHHQQQYNNQNHHYNRSIRYKDLEYRNRYDNNYYYNSNNTKSNNENRQFKNYRNNYDRYDQYYYLNNKKDNRRSDYYESNNSLNKINRKFKSYNQNNDHTNNFNGNHLNTRSRSRLSDNRKSSLRKSSSRSISNRRSSSRRNFSSTTNRSRSSSYDRDRRKQYHKHSSRKQSETPEKDRQRSKIRDDEEGHLIYQIGDTILERYKILKTVGEGTFGKVVKALDLKKNKKIALKLIKNIEKYRKAAKFEIIVLNKLNKWDPDGKHLCVQMLNWDEYYGHVCIAFEILGLSLFDFLKQNNYYPYPIDQVRHISYQLCHAVKFLHDHKLSHTDLKPENILFVNSDFTTYYDEVSKQDVRVVKNTEIRLIDFGSATFDYEHHSSIITTRHYRAPEVILGLGWNESCDVWSVGCILFELYKGDALFQTHKDLEHLAMMKKILGPFPNYLIRRSKCKYFDADGRLNWDSDASYAKYTKKNCKFLFSYIDNDDKDAQQLFDLISFMLNYDPVKRISLRSSLKHKFFDNLPRDKRLSN